MSLDELVIDALGAERARRMEAGTQRLIERAEGAPQFTESLTHILIPLSSKDAAAASQELDELINPDPAVGWNFVTFRDSGGRGFAKASPYFHRTAALGSQDWMIAFATSDLYMRLGAWWFTQMWRGAELAVGARDAINQWRVVISAACARSLLEGAAYLAAEAPALVDIWDGFKKSGTPTIDRLNGFVRDLNRQVTAFQYASRIGQGRGRPPPVVSTNAMTYIKKLAKRTTDIDVMETYEWLCDAVHPSFGSATTYLSSSTAAVVRDHWCWRRR